MASFQRNAPCPCGSGKKYKKCCRDKTSLPEAFPTSVNRHHRPSKDTILRTSTGEYMMAIRLCYTVHDATALFKQLSAWQCVEWKEPVNQQRFLINYCGEMDKMDLPIPTQALPSHPIILAHGKIVESTRLILDLRSYLRGSEMMKLLTKLFSPGVIQLSHVKIWNKIHPHNPAAIKKMMLHDYDGYFLSERVHEIDEGKVLDQLGKYIEDHSQEITPVQGKMALFEEFMRTNSTLHEFESFPMEHDADGLDSFALLLKVREHVALKHYQGDRTYTIYQATMELFFSGDSEHINQYAK